MVPEHDAFPDQSLTDPTWIESSWFSFCVPERRINGFVYYWHKPWARLSGGGPAVWDAAGSHTFDCLYYDWNFLQPTPDGADVSTFELIGGLRARQLALHEHYEIGYAVDGFRLELDWRGLTPPHDLGLERHDTDELPGGHFDQPGRIEGTIELAGERIEVSCYSMRDRTWGPRRPERVPTGDFLWAIASPTSAFHCLAVNAGDAGGDGVIGGFLVRDGVMGDLVEGRRQVLARDQRRPRHVVLDARDSHGRELHAEGRPVNCLHWHGWNTTFTFFCLTEWEFDGATAWGENQEFWPSGTVRTIPQ